MGLDDLLADQISCKSDLGRYEVLPGRVSSLLSWVDLGATAEIVNEFHEDVRT